MIGLPAAAGTYALILRSETSQRVAIGRLGNLDVQPGTYLYVGSAWGAGGLAGRLRHHLAPAPRPHWHIDYLRRVTTIESVWYSAGARGEHEWADMLAAWQGATIPLPGFGASDCRCRAHLFQVAIAPSPAGFQRRAGGPEIQIWISTPSVSPTRAPSSFSAS